MERIRRILEKVELQSYVDVIHDAAIEDWTEPYSEDDIILEEELTNARAHRFMEYVSDHRDNFINFFELVGEIPDTGDLTKEKYKSLILDHIAIRLSAYTKHMRRTSNIFQTIRNEDPDHASDSEDDESEVESIRWSRWLEDYINEKRHSKSRDDISTVINERVRT